jgi:predicted nucleic acid-binding protein
VLLIDAHVLTDAYLAAIAIEHGGEWMSADSDFSRFRGLRWRHPLDVSE